MSLYGVTGRKFHGKDTTAGVFVANGYVQMRFADPIKEMLRAYYRLFKLSDEEIEARIEGPLKETPCPYLAGRTPRYAMQTLGTEWGRQMMAPDFWIQALVRRTALEKDVVVSDVRFINEAQVIRRMGGKVVKVVNPDLEDNEFSAHPSEREIDTIEPDAVILNDGRTMEPIEGAVRVLIAADAP